MTSIGYDANGDNDMITTRMMKMVIITTFSFKSGNKAYQAGKDLDALYLYSQVSLACQVSQKC